MQIQTSCFPSPIKGNWIKVGQPCIKARWVPELEKMKHMQIQFVICSIYCTESHKHSKLDTPVKKKSNLEGIQLAPHFLGC